MLTTIKRTIIPTLMLLTSTTPLLAYTNQYDNVHQYGSKTWQNNPKPVDVIRYGSKLSPVLQQNWFLGIEGGFQRPLISKDLKVFNGTGFPPPSDNDHYSTSNGTHGFMGLSGGRLWQRKTKWFPAYSLAGRYRYMTPTNVGGVVTQYYLPPYQNYDYRWKLTSNVFTAQGKLDVFGTHGIAAYVGLGIGVACHNVQTYSETVKSNVTPRISPDFAGQANNKFTYNAGIGIDWKVISKVILSLGYEYQNLGTVQSGYGTDRWSEQRLSLGRYGMNTGFLSLSYLLDSLE